MSLVIDWSPTNLLSLGRNELRSSAPVFFRDPTGYPEMIQRGKTSNLRTSRWSMTCSRCFLAFQYGKIEHVRHENFLPDTGSIRGTAPRTVTVRLTGAFKARFLLAPYTLSDLFLLIDPLYRQGDRADWQTVSLSTIPGNYTSGGTPPANLRRRRKR